MDEPLWTAYCAPGRKMLAEMALLLDGETVTEVIESPMMLAGSTDIILVNSAAIDEALTFTEPVQIVNPQHHKCPWCYATVAHYPWCSIAYPPLRPLSECIILTGI